MPMFPNHYELKRKMEYSEWVNKKEKQESKGHASGLSSSQLMGLKLLLLHWVCQKLSIF